MTTTARRLRLGAYGEACAARHLTDLGMVVLDRNWRCQAGEIDLVLREGPTLVVCEVKTRTSPDYGAPVEAVTAEKADRLRRLAVAWMEQRGVRPAEVRLDLVGVMVRGTTVVSLDHVRGVG
jgi:putative endonuclease